MSPSTMVSSVCGRNLGKYQLGGCIFGCNNRTMKECLSKQLFGLPAQHFSYVKNINPGLPLFLFNYSDRKLHGIFEASSKGKMYIDAYGWAADCSEPTQYPAQVQIRVRLLCQPLSEDKFRQVIADNYYRNNHFWFELDHRQTNKLMSLLVSLAFAPGTSVPQNTMMWRTVSRSLPSNETPREGDPLKTLESKTAHSTNIVVKEVKQDDKNHILMKLKEMSLKRESQDLSCLDNTNYTPYVNNMSSVEKGYLEVPTGLEKKEESSSPPSEHQYNIAKLMREVQELKAFKKIQTQKNCYVEQKQMETELEIQHLKHRCTMLESACNLPLIHDEKTVIQSSTELHLDPEDSLFLIGGFDGGSWLAAMDLYCPSQNEIKFLKPRRTSVRSYASVVQLNGELYVFGGANGSVWYDRVESYHTIRGNWTSRPCLNQKKGSLAGAALNNKLFAVGGGYGVDRFSLSDVKMLELYIGQWISDCSMQYKRFALAAVELHGVLQASGRYNGIDYLKNALGSVDGSTMGPSIEAFDPSFGAWMKGELMNHLRGYFAAAFFKEPIYVIGGVQVGEKILDTFSKPTKGVYGNKDDNDCDHHSYTRSLIY